MNSTSQSKKQLVKEITLLKTEVAKLHNLVRGKQFVAHALQKGSEQYSSIVESLFIGITVHVANKIVYVNQAVLKMLGYTSDNQLIGRNILEFVHQEDQEKVKHAIEQAYYNPEPLQSVVPEVIEERLIRNDGTEIVVEASAGLINHQDETALVVMLNDVTKYRQAETALKLNEARFSTLISNLPGMAYLCKNDEHWTMLYINDACLQLTGYKPEQLIGNKDISYNDLIHPDDREFVKKHVNKAKDLNKHFELEYRILTASGEERWVWERGIQNKSRNGEEQIEGVIHDITERKKAEAELQESEKRYRLLIENAPIGIVSIDRQGRVIEINPSLMQILGSPSYEASKRVQVFSFPPLVESGIAAALQRCFESGKSYSSETPYLSLWDKSIYVHYRITPNLLENGQVISVQLIVEDITDRKLAEEKVTEKSIELKEQVNKSEAQRIATLSLLSDLNEASKKLKVEINERRRAEKSVKESAKQLRQLTKYMDAKNENEKKRIAKEIHDGLGQLLTGLKMDLQWIARKWPQESARLKSKFLSMNNIIDTGVKEVQKLSIQLRPKMLDELGLMETLESEARQFEERTGIYCNISFVPDSFDMEYNNSSTLYRVLMELLANIYRHAKASRVDIKLEIKTNKCIFTVSDNGVGITKDQIKSKTSFGLFSINERVSALNGSVSIQGRKNKGTTVKVSIPL